MNLNEILNDEGKAKLAELRQLLPPDTSMDLMLAYCISWQILMRAARDVEARGVSLESTGGRVWANPSCGTVATAQGSLAKLAVVLALKPRKKTRAEISAEGMRELLR